MKCLICDNTTMANSSLGESKNESKLRHPIHIRPEERTRSLDFFNDNGEAKPKANTMSALAADVDRKRDCRKLISTHLANGFRFEQSNALVFAVPAEHLTELHSEDSGILNLSATIRGHSLIRSHKPQS